MSVFGNTAALFVHNRMNRRCLKLQLLVYRREKKKKYHRVDYERWFMNIKSIQLLKSRGSTWQRYCITHRKISAARNKNKAIIWHLWQTRVTSEERQTPPLRSLSGKSFIRREILDSIKIKSFSCSWSQQDSQVALSVIRPSYSLISPCLLPAACRHLLMGLGVPDTGATSGQLSMTMFVLSSEIKHAQKREW